MSTRDRVLVAVLSAHVGAVIAFLVAVAADGGVRVLLALAGGALITAAWVAWLRAAAHAERTAVPVGPTARPPTELPVRAA